MPKGEKDGDNGSVRGEKGRQEKRRKEKRKELINVALNLPVGRTKKELDAMSDADIASLIDSKL